MEPIITHAPPAQTFRGLGLAPKLIETLDSLELFNPTPIQLQAIPHAIVGKDVIGVAQTGTGKTLAYGLPLMQRIAAVNGLALILVPTRELALQVDETLSKYGREMGLRGAVLIGGASMGPQVASLRRSPNVIIATPGRLIDHLSQRTLKLNTVSILVLDEADRMLDMGFWPQIKEVLAAIPVDRQTLLFSATLSKEILGLATKHMKTPTSIEVSRPGTTVENITQEFFIVRKDEKMQLLESVLTQYPVSTIVFSKTKHGAKRITKALRDQKIPSAEIHANRSLGQRREALDGFKSGRYRVLVATDIAARGIDVKGVELVINYDIPMQSEDYVHRIGRTARAGAVGRAISFAMPDEKRGIRNIENLIRMRIPLLNTPTLPPRRATVPDEFDRDNGRDQRSSQRSSFGARPFGRAAGRPSRPSSGSGFRGRSSSQSSSRPNRSSSRGRSTR